MISSNPLSPYYSPFPSNPQYQGGVDLELRTKKEDVFMQNNRILFLRNVHSLVRALRNNIFNFRSLSVKTFETYPTFRRIFLNFMRAREFISKPALQALYSVLLIPPLTNRRWPGPCTPVSYSTCRRSPRTPSSRA